MTEDKKDTAVGKPFDIVTLVTTQLREYTDKRELVLPANYSVENALKSAWLALQQVEDKDHQPALRVCTQASIANALLDMAVQGLNPGKDQCYFIAYGKTLACQRSYFGTMAVAQRVAGASDIWAEVVYEADKFEYAISHNRKNVVTHTQKLENIKPKAIVAAYCVIEFNTSKPTFTEIMTIAQIKQAWKKSKVDPDSPGSPHSQFPEEMAKRTVTNRACKAMINSSSDSNLFLEHFNRSDEELVVIELKEEIEKEANQEMLDVDPGTGGDPGTGEIVEGSETGEIVEDKTIDRDPASLKTISAMLNACHDDFGLEKEQALAELGVSTHTQITESPADCYRRIATVRVGPEKVVEGEPGF